MLTAPGAIIAVLAELTTTTINPVDLPDETPKAATLLADTGCDVLVIGEDVEHDAALALTEQVVADFPEIEVLWLGPTEPLVLAEAMGAGARLVIAPATDPGEIRSSVHRIASRAARRRHRLTGDTDEAPVAVDTERGQVMSVVAAKGGVGKTTIAVNVAVELARHHPHEVVLVDFDLLAGDADALLGLQPAASLASVAMEGAVVDTASVKLALSTHPSGLLVLPAPETLIEGGSIDPALLTEVLRVLRSSFDHVIIDTGPGAGPELEVAVANSADVLAVATPDLSGLRSLRRVLEGLDTLGHTAARRHLILNRADYRTGLTSEAIEATAELAIAHTIPDSRDIAVAANQGVPYVSTSPRADGVRALKSLVARLDDTPARREAASAVPSGGFGRSGRS